MKPCGVAGRGVSLGLVLFSCSLPGWAQGIEIPEVVVEVRRSPANPRMGVGDGTLMVIDRAFAPVSVVDRQEIVRDGGRTLGDVLFGLPGVTGSGLVPGAASRPIIRGLDTTRVRVQENGIGAQDVSELGEDHAVPIDPAAAQRIEVIRGPAALRFGGQAIGGVVNVVTGRIPTAPARAGFEASSTTAISSVDRGVEQSLRVNGQSGAWGLSADVFGRAAGDYDVPGGRQANSFAFSRGFSIGTSYFFDGGFIGGNLQHMASLYGIPGVVPAANRTRIDLNQTRLNVRGEVSPERGPFDILRFWMGGSIYRHNEESAAVPGAFGINATFRNDEIEGRFEAAFRPIRTALGLWTTVVGTQMGGANLGTAGEAGGLVAPTQTRSAAAYLFSTLELGASTRVQGAARIEHVTVGGTATLFPGDLVGSSGDPVAFARQRTFTPASGSFALLQDLPFGFVGSLTAQVTERAPRSLELFSRGPHEATGTFEIGNSALRKERAQSIEIGLRRAEGPLRLDVSAYHSRFSGFIYKRVTGLRCDDEFATCGTGSELTQVAYAQQDATFTGAEFRAQLDVGEVGGGTLAIEGQYDFVRARFADGTNAPRIPPHRLGGGLVWRDGAWFGRVRALHAFSQTNVAPEETTTPGYTLVNADLSYRWAPVRRDGPGVREVIAGVSVTNLLNQTIRNHVSFRKDEVVQPGRGVRATLTVRW